MNRRLLASAAAMLLLGIGIGQLSTSGFAQQKPQSQVKGALVTAAAQQVGVRRCLPAIAAIADRGIQGATMQDIIIDWDRQRPDMMPFFSLTAIGAGVQRAAMTIAAFPTAEDCAILVERVSATPQSCTAVAASELPRFPSGRLIDGITVYQNPQQAGETYTLVNNGTGCLIIRRQAAFKWPPR